MRFSEKLLLFLSRDPNESDFSIKQPERTVENALNLMIKIFPNFLKNIYNNNILDFGCGNGHHAISLIQNGAKYVVGIENNPNVLKNAIILKQQYKMSQLLQFKENIEESDREKFDIVISINSMEHFINPKKAIEQMKFLLKPQGKIIIKFEPPWFSPYGSHTHYFTKLPWVNLLFREKIVMEARSHFRKDGATKYSEIEGGLNKMSVKKFEKLVSDCNLKFIYKRYDCVKKANFLGKIPGLRELFINRISCKLSKE